MAILRTVLRRFLDFTGDNGRPNFNRLPTVAVYFASASHSSRIQSVTLLSTGGRDGGCRNSSCTPAVLFDVQPVREGKFSVGEAACSQVFWQFGDKLLVEFAKSLTSHETLGGEEGV